MAAGNPIKRLLKHVVDSAKFKYHLVICTVGMVHVCLVVLFAFLHIRPMVLLNIGSVAVYAGCLWAIRHDWDMRGVFYATYLEIIIQSFAATFCIGWRFGFTQYLIALVPFGYYMCHILIDNRRGYVVATILGVIAFGSFVSCRVLSMNFGTLYHPDIPETVEVGIYIFNTFCNFTFLFMVTTIFLLEMYMATNQLQKQNAILDTMANIDPLTGLYNRRRMHSFLDEVQAAHAKEPFCLVMCDIDDFKKVNDAYGHDAGDDVLKEVARIAQEHVGQWGRACRWGGEEMLLIVRGDLEQACRIAEVIRQEVNGFVFRFKDQAIHCSLTIGVALHQGEGAIDHTITRADDNLYFGKHNGKNRVVSDLDMEQAKSCQEKY